MTLDIGRLEAMKDVREAIRLLKEKDRRLMSPVISPDMLNEMFAIFCDMTGFPDKHGSEAVNLRRAFMFVVLCLLCPAVFAGGSLPRGLRNSCASLFGLRCPTVLSQDSRLCEFLYSTYRDFRRIADNIHDSIVYKLQFPHARTREDFG